jgi:multicomponent Na+:H+ antiporter subunit E
VSNPACGAAIARWLGLFCLWLILFGTETVALAVGAATAALAAWVSLRLLTPDVGWPHPLALVRLAGRFLWQSAVAGADVARRALDPSLPLQPGLVRCPVRVRSRSARSAFCAFLSLMPGTLVAGAERDGELLVHCLDVRQDVAEQLRVDEDAFLAVGGAGDG